ncbi:MAG TPA: hypothetical protein VGR80_06055 [Steroidobacteraceae bacterium]|nr:hypothetical protein [Gammaproteobacteria bacterium]HEV2285586.1 hypothetical protein [Steroidobacteraceae bacterium]
MRFKIHTSASAAGTAPRARWQSALRRHLAALLLMKIAVLALLWALFFSAAHRTPVDGAAVSRHLLPAQEASHD